MNSAEHAPAASWKDQIHQLSAELEQMLKLRRELATLEISADRQLIRRCLIIGSLGAVMTLVGLPLLLQIAAQELANLTPVSATAWTLILGSVLLGPGLLLLIAAMRTCRSEFRGLRDTLAELNEDLIWLREWLPSAARDSGDTSTHDEDAV